MQTEVCTPASSRALAEVPRRSSGGEYILVALRAAGTPFPEPLTYTIPPPLRGHVDFASTLLVPLGGQELVGAAVGFPEEAPEGLRLRSILAVLDPAPGFDERLYGVAEWMAGRYHCGLGEALQPIMPESHAISARRVLRLTGDWPEGEAGLARWGRAMRGAAGRLRRLLEESGGEIELADFKRRFPTPALSELLRQVRSRGWIEEEYRLSLPKARNRTVRTWSLAPDAGNAAVEAAEALAPGSTEKSSTPRLGERQQRVLEYLRERAGHAAPQPDLCRHLDVPAAVLQSLERRGLVTPGETTVNRAARPALPPAAAPALIPDQAAAAVVLADAVRRRAAEGFLLFGVTGSGKTEVYLHAIEEALAAGRQAIFLVPEISLTVQVATIFRSRFGERVAILHSRLSDGERFDEWARIRRGEADVVVGARSALFAPAPDPGVIVLDEEHDHSYKQDSSPRYVTGAVAERRASLTGCPVILGSATPSLESFYRSSIGELRRLDLPRRIHDRPLPQVRVVDLRVEFRQRGAGVFSAELREAIRERLSRGEQVILFVNRRGFSAFILCRDCGFVPRCPRCNVSLTFHADRVGRLACHHCGHERRAPENCPRCAGTRIRHFGIGTQRVEEAALSEFPAARVARLDRDTTTGRDSHQRIVSGFKAREADLLIGTQMVAKGFDFPHVTLVGIITADTALNLPDFRAAERTFQLLTQVAGRAGRGETPGEVILQTFTPEHPAIQAATEHDYPRFYADEIRAREELRYPPFASLARFLAADSQEEVARGKIHAIRDLLAAPTAAAGVELLGPTAAPLARLSGKYRWHLLLKSEQDAALHSLLVETLPRLRRTSGWFLDVDPLSLM
jgi:primosomal protein N' (replication factor Y)